MTKFHIHRQWICVYMTLYRQISLKENFILLILYVFLFYQCQRTVT